MSRELLTPAIDSPPLRRYGLPELVYGETPAAGAGLTISLDGNFLVRLLSLYLTLTTDATVGDRQVTVSYADQAGDRFMVAGAPVTQAASSVNDWCFSVFQPQAEWPVDATILVPLAPKLLLPTQKIVVAVGGIEVADAITGVRYTWERFYNDPVG